MIQIQFVCHPIRSLCHALEVREVGTSTKATIEASQRFIAEAPESVVEQLRLLQRNSSPQEEISARIAAAAKEIALSHSKWESRVASELKLRKAFLEEHWLVRGPGLVRSVLQVVGQSMHSNDEQTFEIHLVLPLMGGGAASTPLAGRWFEAVLHDISPVFPELLRVGYLLTEALIQLAKPNQGRHSGSAKAKPLSGLDSCAEFNSAPAQFLHAGASVSVEVVDVLYQAALASEWLPKGDFPVQEFRRWLLRDGL